MRTACGVGWTLMLAVFLGGCPSPGQYVWVQQYVDQEGRLNQADYVVAAGDTLAIRVYEQEAVSTRARVRADGKISVALVGDVTVVGKHPTEVAADIAGKLKQYIKDPSVMVSVEEIRPIAIPVLGEVGHPGIYQVDSSAGILEALAAAGGLGDFATRDFVFVLRPRPTPVRIRFSYDALVHNDPQSIAFTLRPGDTVVVE